MGLQSRGVAWDVVLLSSFEEVERHRKARALCGDSEAFGCLVTTFEAWLRALWELHGDGRALVDAAARDMMLMCALREEARATCAEKWPLSPLAAPGMGALAARVVRAAAGLAEFERALDEASAGGAPDGFSLREADLMRAVARYRRELDALGMIEPGTALSVLMRSQAAVFPQPVRVLDCTSAPADMRKRRFFDAVPNIVRYVPGGNGAPGCTVLLGDAGAAARSEGLPSAAVQAAEEDLPSPEQARRSSPGAESPSSASEALLPAAGVEVAFAFPAGRYALPGIVADAALAAVEELRSGEGCAERWAHACGKAERTASGCEAARGKDAGRAVAGRDGSDSERAVPERDREWFEAEERCACLIACADPEALHAAIAPRLTEAGVACALEAAKSFPAIDFGRAFLACRDGCVDGDREALVDFLLSPFSGITKRDAWDFDRRMRGDRLFDLDAGLRELCAKSDAFSRMSDLVLSPDADILIGSFEEQVRAMRGRSEAYRREQLGALAVLRAHTSAARLCGGSMGDCVELVRRTAVGVSRVCGCAGAIGGRAPLVVVTTPTLASRRAPRSASVLVLPDMSAQAHPLAEPDDAATTLLARLGVLPPESRADRARRDFGRLLRVASRRIVAGRPLNDESANPTWPSMLFEEMVDALRARAAGMCESGAAGEEIEAACLDETLRIPFAWAARAVQRGEEDLFANARALAPQSAQPIAASCAPRLTGELSPTARRQVHVVRRRTSEGALLESPAPSASQLEAYLGCPYRWFVERRLSPQGVDEGFGPLEKGAFAHAVLERFYRTFAQEGHAKVTEDNIDCARAAMRRALAEEQDAQQDLKPGSGRLVPLGEFEWHEFEALSRALERFLDFEKELLPRFRPKLFEYAIDADHAVEYAGHKLVGRIDRVDVDDGGHAAIIDYKGSVTSAYASRASEEGAELSGKVQTLVYAQVVRRAFGWEPVAALYVAYNGGARASGAYDPVRVGPADLPGADERSACAPEGERSFSGLLDATEQRCAQAIDGMQEGLIAPAPASDDECAFCVALNCPERRKAAR